MKKTILYCVLVGVIVGISVAAVFIFGQHRSPDKKLKRQMKKMAVEYLANDSIKDYDSLKIDRVDTLTEMGYAKLNFELLEEMEFAYQYQYEEAEVADNQKDMQILRLYLSDITRTKDDLLSLMQDESLDTKETLLFMVTGSYHKDKETIPIMFFVQPDKKTLHQLDPFGDNLLYKDEE